MATTKKTGIVEKVKDAITGIFTSDKPARKSPKRVAAGKKAAVTARTTKAVAATKEAAKKAVKAAAPAAKKTRR